MKTLSAARIVITGGTGFVGQYLRKRLLQLSCRTVILARRASVCERDEEVVVGDLTDPDFVSGVLAAVAPNVIFHLASTRLRSIAPEDVRHSIATNVPLAINVFAAACKLPSLTSIVSLGTAEEYGTGSVPFAEEQREAPASAYSLSKLCITHLAQILYRAHGLPAVVLRPGILYGPGQPEDMLIAQLFSAARLGEPLAMTLGEQTRDLLYVDDAVEAMLRAAVTPSAWGEVINIGSGEQIQLSNLIQLIQKVTGRPNIARIGAKAYRSNEIMHYSLDLRKANKILGWEARTSLEKGLDMTWQGIP